MGFYATNQEVLYDDGRFIGEKITLEEFERILEKENIPRKWVSLNEDYTAPVTLTGDTLHYGKYGSLRFLEGINYGTILTVLRNYKEEQDFIKSDQIARITYISIISSESIKEYGDDFLVTRNGDEDEELLKQGFEYKGYDRYMGYHTYEKICGDEIFTGVEIILQIKTQDFERDQYGFEDIMMDSSVTFPLPMKLKSQIVKYIKENKTTVISKIDPLFHDIIDLYGFEHIVEDESKRIKFLDEAYRNILGYELMHQKFLEQYSEDKLLDVYREINLGNIFSRASTLTSRQHFIETARLKEAQKKLNELMNKQ